MRTQYIVNIGGEHRAVVVESTDEQNYRITVDDNTLELDAREVGAREYHVLHEGHGHDLMVDGAAPVVTVLRNGETVEVNLLDERQAARMAAAGLGPQAADGAVEIKAPMPGKVVKALVSEGDEVSAGQGVIVVEAMKMENELRTPVDGTVRAVKTSEGDSVEAGQTLVVVE